ncbi:MAG: hypothetical protein FJ109_03690 [Deltaproteobacteria bacterium]|nr:hypothetical protein [Deltaproteobacteria bacterium]
MQGPPPGVEATTRSQARDTTDCPHCGRYVGPLELCPYCREVHRKRLVITLFKYVSPLLAIAGMFFLHHLGKTSGNPLVKVGDLGPTSNFAYIVIEGTVCEEPRFYRATGTQDPTAGSLEFCLDDGTGQTRVKTYEDATRRVIAERKLPAVGDHVRVTGNFQTRLNKHSLIVGSPHEIEFLGLEEAVVLSAGEVATAPKDRFEQLTPAVVTGYVRFNYNDRDKGYSAVLHLSQEREKKKKERYLRIEIPYSRLELEGVMSVGARSWAGIPGPGTRVRVSGNLKWSGRGKYPGWRLHPGWAADIEVLERPAEDVGGDHGSR